MLSLCLGFLVSFLMSLVIVRYAHMHAHFSADWDLAGVQKNHSRPVPRIGGLAITIGFVAVILSLYIRGPHWVAHQSMLLGVSALAAFAAGTIEDITKKVSPRERLIATMISALMAAWLLDARIVRIDVNSVDAILHIAIIAVPLTMVAVAGLANAINIIDGFNGFASMISAMMFLSLAYVAFQVGDAFIVAVSFTMIGAILGFFIWNFPGGHIFLGDGGAYFVGFMLAELAIILVMRHPNVSAWYPVLMVIYPIFETLFSIYRRRILRGVPAGYPDGVHLHTLIYKRLLRWAIGSKEERQRLRRNSMTAPYLWMLSLLAVAPATLFWHNTAVLVPFILVFIITYVWLYSSIVRFKSPRWMIIDKKN